MQHKEIVFGIFYYKNRFAIEKFQTINNAYCMHSVRIKPILSNSPMFHGGYSHSFSHVNKVEALF